MEQGVFTISLDFELYWGMRDKRSIEQYKRNLQGVRRAVPELLRMFRENNIHATWATVGFLFFEDTAALRKQLPRVVPKYKREELSPYKYIAETPNLEAAYHFAPDLIDQILEHEGQEIGTHTFSHYYCLEEGQSLAEFEEDLSSAVEIAKRRNVSITSLVFPRNQRKADYLPSLGKMGVLCYRGNQPGWAYDATDDGGQHKLRMAFRLVDAYLDLSGHNTYDLKDCRQERPFNFPASRFLRPYAAPYAALERLRLRRIRKAMDDAAINARIFHLWWHPHNFGVNTERNLDFLARIVKHFTVLKKKHGMVSLNMGELCGVPGAETA